MKLLVTGREGQLARSLTERVARRGDVELITLARPDVDFAQPDTAARAIIRLAPDVVLNAAAYTAVDQAEDESAIAHRINAEAPGRLAAAAAKIGARFIQISTDYVYPGDGDEPYREDAPTGPLGIYGCTKLAGEQAALAACPDTVVVRTAWIYSPFGRNFLKTMVTLAETRETLTVVGDQFGNPSSAFDIADGLLALLSRWTEAPRTGLGRIYHLAGFGSTSWAGFAAEIMAQCRKAGLPSAAVTPIVTADWPTRAARPRNSRLDSTAFAHDTGYRAPRWQDSTAETVVRLAAG